MAQMLTVSLPQHLRGYVDDYDDNDKGVDDAVAWTPDTG